MNLYRLASLEKKLDKVAGLIIAALKTDGEHHKQWYLEQIATVLDIDLAEVDFEGGIPP